MTATPKSSPPRQRFRKTSRQKRAVILMNSTARHIMLYGGSRSGKTFIIIRNMVIRACKEANSNHAILRLKFNAAKKSIWLKTLPDVIRICFPDLGITEKNWNRSDYFLSLPNGSKIWVGGLDDAERVEKILGNEYSTLFFNECSQIPMSSILVALTRLAEKNGLIKKVYYDENPPSKKHWSYWTFIKHWDSLAEVALNKDEYVSMVLNPKDNIENIDEEYISMLEKMPGKERQRFLDGEFTDSDDGLAYYAFDPERHIGETKLLPGTIYVGMDFNVNPMTAMVFQIQGGKFVYHDELWLPNSDTYKMCDELIRRGYRGATVIPDSTGKNRKTSGKSDFNILAEHGFKVEYVTNPHQSDRVNNQNRLFTANRIIINPRCKKLRNDFEQVSWKDNKLDEGKDKQLTHISDAATYGTWKLDPIGIIDYSKYKATLS